MYQCVEQTSCSKRTLRSAALRDGTRAVTGKSIDFVTIFIFFSGSFDGLDSAAPAAAAAATGYVKIRNYKIKRYIVSETNPLPYLC